MSRFRPMSELILATLCVLFVSVFLFSSQVSALGLEPSIFGGGFSRQSEVDSIKNTVQTKTQEVQVHVKELETVSKTKEELTKELTTLKSQLANLDNMFVHINKYAPDAAGNRYAAGNCTWYVKSMRPDIGNFWGNANTWYQNAKAQGWSVGDLPKKGAAATTTQGWAGHVAYVTGVSLDQKWVTIREMNYGGLYNMNDRTVYYTEFKYIYELN